jgi:hypothetical protein
VGLASKYKFDGSMDCNKIMELILPLVVELALGLDRSRRREVVSRSHYARSRQMGSYRRLTNRCMMKSWLGLQPVER